MFDNRCMYSFSVQELAVTINMINFNLP